MAWARGRSSTSIPRMIHANRRNSATAVKYRPLIPLLPPSRSQADDDSATRDGGGDVFVLEEFFLQVSRREPIESFETQHHQANANQAEDDGGENGHAERVRVPR